MRLKHFGLFAPSQSDKQRTQRSLLMSIHGPGWRQKTQPGHTFQPASAPAHKLNPGISPFKERKKGYNITSFRQRERLVGVTGWRDSCHSLLWDISWFRFQGKSGSLCCEQTRGEKLSGLVAAWSPEYIWHCWFLQTTDELNVDVSVSIFYGLSGWRSITSNSSWKLCSITSRDALIPDWISGRYWLKWLDRKSVTMGQMY